MAASPPVAEKEFDLDWHLSDFESKFHREEIVQMGEGGETQHLAMARLRKPFPVSDNLVTEFGHLSAKWKLRFESSGGEIARCPYPEDYDSHWDIFLDLDSTHYGSSIDKDNGDGCTATICAKITVNCSINFLTATGNESFYSTGAKDYTLDGSNPSAKLGWPIYVPELNEGPAPDYFENRNTVTEILKDLPKWLDENGTFRVRLKMRYVDSSPGAPSRSSLLANLSEDFRFLRGLLRENNPDTDLVIHCGQKAFHAHRLILTTRSPVFKAMLRPGTGMQESATGVVRIEDVDPLVMPRLLDFIYSGDVDLDGVDQEEVAGLIQAADKYQLPVLKDFCFQTLLTSLSLETCGPLAVLAHLHNVAEGQKRIIWAFVAENFKTLSTRPGFKQQLRQYPNAFLPTP